MSPVGFEIDDESVLRFVAGAIAAPAGHAGLVPGVTMPFHLVFEVRR